MKKLFCTFILIVFIATESQTQGFSNLWMSGYSCCSPGFGGTNIDWSSGMPVSSYVSRDMNFGGTNANITNERGELLFYTNGDYIANSLNDTMVNGSGLTPGYFANNNRTMGFPIPQGALILPEDVNNSSLYYLFHEAGDPNMFLVVPSQLNYTIIDMSLDNGLGAVVSKNNVLINDRLAFGLITACRHANGRDWWVVVPKAASNLYHIFLLTPYGISHTTQQIGIVMDPHDWGQVVFSPDGNHYARMDSYNGLQVMNFDRCSGAFSNFQHIDSADFSGSPMFTGVAFSPNSQILYVSHTLYLFQFDLLAPNLGLSKTLVATYDGFTSPSSTIFSLANLFSDRKIYIVTGGGSDRLHVINFPDSLGLACNVQQHSLVLPTYNAATIPTPPNFFSGAVGGTVCDSLITGVSHNYFPNTGLELSPNPAHEKINLHCNSGFIHEVRICDAIGAQSFMVYKNLDSENIELSLNDLPAGVYILEVVLSNNRREFKKLVHQ